MLTDIECELGSELASEGQVADPYGFSKKTPVLTEKEERQLGERWKEYQDKEAYDKLVLHNLRFVRYIVRLIYLNRCMLDLDDLVQYGTVGLLLAVSGFDPNKGRLTTYAASCICTEINKALNGLGDVNVNGHTSRNFPTLKRIEAKLLAKNIQPSIPAIAREWGIPEKRVRELIATLEMKDARSIDGSEMGDGFLFQHPLGKEALYMYNPEEIAALREEFRRREKHLQQLFQTIDDMPGESLHNKKVFRILFGYKRKRCNLKQTAKIFGVSYQAIQFIRDKILGALRDRNLRYTYRSLKAYIDSVELLREYAEV